MLKSLQEISVEFWTRYKQEKPNLKSFTNEVSTQEVLERIEQVVYRFLSQLFTGEKMSVSYIKPTLSSDFDASTGINRISNAKYSSLALSDSSKSLVSFARFLKILEIIQRLLKNGEKATKREIFYRDPSLFSCQSISDKAIESISLILEVPRNRLNILSAGKGLVSGALSYHENNTKVTLKNRICKIPNDIDSVSCLRTTASFILIVEKDTILNRLVDEQFFQETNCIGITGCGYPDLSTREFVRRIIEEFSWIPVLVLTDFDPHGFHILCTYTFGSYSKAAECDSLAIPTAHWLGVHFGDTNQSSLTLSNNDVSLLHKLLRAPQFLTLPTSYQTRRFALWRDALHCMLESNTKYEIESLLTDWKLSDYINVKIQKGAWL